MARVAGSFLRAKRPQLKPSPTVLLLVDFINPMRFPQAVNLLPGALQAAQAEARFKKRLAARCVTAIFHTG